MGKMDMEIPGGKSGADKLDSFGWICDWVLRGNKVWLQNIDEKNLDM